MRNSGCGLFVTPNELSQAEYNISVNIDAKQNTYNGLVSIVWTNQSPMPIKRLCIDRGIIAENDLIIQEINGISPSKYDMLFHEKFILIDMPVPLNCGDSFVFKAKFSSQLPTFSFHAGDIIAVNSHVAWYPRLFWDEPIGSTCKVTFESITDGYQVFAAGDKSGSTYLEKNIANYYGFAISKKMTSISQEVNGITVSVVHYPKHKACAEFMMETAVDSLSFFIKFVGMYPYKSFTIIPGSPKWHGGGNFSSGMVYVHNFESYNPGDHEYVDYYKAMVPHEIGHQYFWEYVIENENPGWLGLGLSMALDREYSRYKAGINSFHKMQIDRYLNYVLAGKNTTITLPEEAAWLAFDGNDNDFGDNYHGNVVHGKSFSIVSMLMDVIGKVCFYDVMRYILDNYGGKALYTHEYIKLCEKFSGMKLCWFFTPWLKSNKSLSYSLDNITEIEEGGVYTLMVEVGRRGFISAPVCVRVTFEDGSYQTTLTERLLGKQTISFTASSKYVEIAFDPYEAYAMKPHRSKYANDCATL